MHVRLSTALSLCPLLVSSMLVYDHYFKNPFRYLVREPTSWFWSNKRFLFRLPGNLVLSLERVVISQDKEAARADNEDSFINVIPPKISPTVALRTKLVAISPHGFQILFHLPTRILTSIRPLPA